MNTYIEHDDTGRIVGQMILAESDAIQMRASGHKLIRSDKDPAAHYVRDGMLVPRPTMGCKREGNVLTNLPRPCMIMINSTGYQCEDGRAELHFQHPGTFQVRIVAWPYIDQEFTFEN